MRKRYDKYELEIIFTLGILILFLISVNFISGYSFEEAIRGQDIQFRNSLQIASSLIKSELESDILEWEQSSSLLAEKLRDLSVLTGINHISVINSVGDTLAALGRILPDSGSNEIVTIERPVNKYHGQTAVRLVVSAENRVGERYAALSRWDILFRVMGVFSALIVAFFFIKAVLNPYRKIKSEAIDYNLDLKNVDSGKGIEYVVNTFKDVIDELEDKKARLEAMYNNSEKRADSLARYNDYILGSISSGVVICDSEGYVTRFNPSAEKILKYFEGDCRGKHYTEIFGEKHYLSLLFDDALQRGITHSRREFEIRRPDGEKLWLGCSSSMINDEKREAMGAVLLMIDLSEIRRLQELSTYSEKMASLGELSAGLAHEIRNSFAAVFGFAKLLRKKTVDSGNSELVEAIIKESNSAEDLLSRFLNFASPLSYCPENCDINALVDSVLKSFNHPNLYKINLKKRDSYQINPIKADPVLLKQALQNLLINACDAMPDGGDLIVEIKPKDEKPDASELAISISDTGVGISEENINKVFEPFHTDKTNGTGLGLALVKKIVVLHEGRVTVKSIPEKGTRFTIYLPMVKFDDYISSHNSTRSLKGIKVT